MAAETSDEIRVCINETLTDDELRSILSKLQSDKDKEGYGLVCKRWLHLQSTERRKLCARAGPLMLRKMAARFTRLHELDLSQSASRSFYPGVTDSDLSVIATGFQSLQILKLHNCKEVAKEVSASVDGSVKELIRSAGTGNDDHHHWYEFNRVSPGGPDPQHHSMELNWKP